MWAAECPLSSPPHPCLLVGAWGCQSWGVQGGVACMRAMHASGLGCRLLLPPHNLHPAHPTAPPPHPNHRCFSSCIALPSPLHPPGAVYAGSKAFIDCLSRSLDAEYRSAGVRVQNQAPMFVATKMSKIRWGGRAGADLAGGAELASAVQLAGCCRAGGVLSWL